MLVVAVLVEQLELHPMLLKVLVALEVVAMAA
jgi:hypothetical protein